MKNILVMSIALGLVACTPMQNTPEDKRTNTTPVHWTTVELPK